MNTKLLTIGLVAAVILAAIGYVALGASGGGDVAGEATATIYVEDVGTGEVYSAEIDIGAPDLAEQAMLSFGDIRTTAFQPLASTPGDAGGLPTKHIASVFKASTYKVWMTVSFTVNGENIDTVKKVEVKFYGTAGATSSSTVPDHLSSANRLYSSLASSDSPVLTRTSGITVGKQVVISQADTASMKFDKVNVGTGYVTLTGDMVDCAYLNVDISVLAEDLNGNEVSASKHASLRLWVDAYGTSTLSVSIDDLNGGLA
jgi:hypothetical protein